MTERIDHAADAVKTMDETLSYGEYGEDAGEIASMLAAQVRATLALVEQQRIANLIAYVGVAQQVPHGSRLTDAEASDLAILQAQAREGLGL